MMYFLKLSQVLLMRVLHQYMSTLVFSFEFHVSHLNHFFILYVYLKAQIDRTEKSNLFKFQIMSN